MRILHTADWHMGRKLGRQPLDNDIRCSLEQIAIYLDSYQVDVMVVAGDIFESISRMEAMRQAVFDIKDIFQAFLHRGGTIVAISGNHDNELFFEMLRDALDLVTSGLASPQGVDPVGRLYVSPNARLLKLADRKGNIVQFALMPYPRSRAYVYEQNATFATPEERNRAIQETFKARLGNLQARLDPTLPSVLVSHILIRGIRPYTEYALTEVEDVIFESGDIPAHWSYIAYGHIHRPQPAVRGAEHIRYAGSIVPTNGSERDDKKSVVICDIQRNGTTQVQIMPLKTTSMYRIEITDPDIQIPILAEQHSNSENALVHYTLHWDPTKHNRQALCREIETIFPRWYERSFQLIGETKSNGPALEVKAMQDVAGTVRRFLEAQLGGNPRREQLLTLAESLISEEM